MVTVVFWSAESAKQSNKQKLMLYELLAGSLEEYPNQTGTNPLSTKTFMNDDIHNQIVAEWNSSFLQRLSKDEQALWKRNCPALVVTSQFPFRDGSLIADVTPFKADPVNNREAVSYCHPEEKNLYLRVFKPQSPSDQEHGFPDHDPIPTRPRIQQVINTIYTIHCISNCFVLIKISTNKNALYTLLLLAVIRNALIS